eukprot:GILI01011282.1.p1 GENE.GILI01011282.1~~GILI01011282.1.p1  ORF type:complete len:472 (+),score=114.83 GILI01011282.1:54-1469(+)
MQKVAVLSLILFLCSVTPALAENWAVLAAGSSGWANYRHQADVCHAYNLLLNRGFKKSHIILFLYDDVADNFQNPFRGQLFNAPDPKGPGVDVYVNCGDHIDYRREDATPANFLKVLKGDASGMKGIGSGKVLKSTSEDRVFIFFSDHGADGILQFPAGDHHYLYANELVDTLKFMHEKQKYQELVFYLEACESGSMFEGLLPSDIKVYATTAAQAHESSYATYCNSQSIVNGKEMTACLGDLYAVSWMEHVEQNDMSAYSIDEQFKAVQQRTAVRSHVCMFGDSNIGQRPVSSFLGTPTKEFLSKVVGVKTQEDKEQEKFIVSSRDVQVEYLYRRYMRASAAVRAQETGVLSEGEARAPAPTKEVVRQYQQELMEELSSRQKADDSFHKFVSSAFPGLTLDVVMGPQSPVAATPKNFSCLKSSVQLYESLCGPFTDYSLQYVRVLVAACESGVVDVAQAVTSSCDIVRID